MSACQKDLEGSCPHELVVKRMTVFRLHLNKTQQTESKRETQCYKSICTYIEEPCCFKDRGRVSECDAAATCLEQAHHDAQTRLPDRDVTVKPVLGLALMQAQTMKRDVYKRQRDESADMHDLHTILSKRAINMVRPYACSSQGIFYKYKYICDEIFSYKEKNKTK